MKDQERIMKISIVGPGISGLSSARLLNHSNLKTEMFFNPILTCFVWCRNNKVGWLIALRPIPIDKLVLLRRHKV